jgi:phosphoserine aminotransferase
MSHRCKAFTDIAEKARSDLRKLLNVPEEFTIMFMHGGASQQWSAVCQNVYGDDECGANFLTTGAWSEAAFNDAKKFGKAHEITDRKKHNYRNVDDPSSWNVNTEGSTRFFHYCDNETVQGFEFNEFPHDVKPEGQLMVCDMSSNIATKAIDWSKYDIVYAGAQKNLGPAGVCVVIVHNKILDAKKLSKTTPITNDWQTFRKAANMFHNTPACFPIYMLGLNVEYMLEQGGLPTYQALAEKRSSLLYDYIDSTEGYYVAAVDKKYRSRVNIPFRIREDEALEKKFIAEAAKEGLQELAGHRSVGGMRASLYNAMPLEGVEALVAFMKRFKEANP